MISLVFTFLLAVTPSTAGSGECADSVQGVPFSSSRCMETYQGAQCTVTCTDGTTGESTFTCLNGIWIGDLVCQPLPQKPRFALFAPGQFCEPEDFEHIYFGPVTSAAECAYKVSQNSLCTNTFYTGCCGSAVCACVRIGMRCAMEEADEEYLGTNVYQLINSNHPGQFGIVNSDTWDPNPDPSFGESFPDWNMPTGIVRTCADSVQGVAFGSSRCMDTSEGAQCTVTCTDGTTGESTFICMNGFWVGGLNCQLPPEGTCTDSVQGVDHGSSLCMDTSEGAQCTVTCMGGAIGEGIFICENGIWEGDLVCQLPPEDQLAAGRRLLHVGRLLSLEE